MQSKQLETLVLQTRPFGENHRMVTLLTVNVGVHKAVAFSAQKLQHPLYAVCQPLVRSRVLFTTPEQGLREVVQGQIITGYERIKTDVVLLAYAQAMCELVLRVAQDDVSEAGTKQSVNQRDLFAIFDRSLSFMEKNNDPWGPFSFLQLWMMRYLGLGDDPSEWAAVVQAGVAQDLALASQVSLDEYLSSPLDRAVSKTITAALSQELDDRAGIKLKSRRVIDSLERLYL